jgi:hypothetical protein
MKTLAASLLALSCLAPLAEARAIGPGKYECTKGGYLSDEPSTMVVSLEPNNSLGFTFRKGEFDERKYVVDAQTHEGEKSVNSVTGDRWEIWIFVGESAEDDIIDGKTLKGASKDYVDFVISRQDLGKDDDSLPFGATEAACLWAKKVAD